MKLYRWAAVSCLALSAPALAQTDQSQVVEAQVSAIPVVSAIITTPTDNVLRVGAPIILKMNEELTTKGKKLRVGQRFNLETAEAVTLNGMVVIPAGSPAVGEVTDVRNKGMWGKSGKINARLLYVRVGDRQIRISGQIDDKGVTGTAGVVGAIAFAPIAGFFMTGTSANIPLGAPVRGFLDEDVVVAFAQPVPQPVAIEAVPVATAVAAEPVATPVAAAPLPAPTATAVARPLVIRPATAAPLRVYPVMARPAAAKAAASNASASTNYGVIIQ